MQDRSQAWSLAHLTISRCWSRIWNWGRKWTFLSIKLSAHFRICCTRGHVRRTASTVTKRASIIYRLVHSKKTKRNRHLGSKLRCFSKIRKIPASSAPSSYTKPLNPLKMMKCRRHQGGIYQWYSSKSSIKRLWILRALRRARSTTCWRKRSRFSLFAVKTKCKIGSTRDSTSVGSVRVKSHTKLWRCQPHPKERETITLKWGWAHSDNPVKLMGIMKAIEECPNLNSIMCSFQHSAWRHRLTKPPQWCRCGLVNLACNLKAHAPLVTTFTRSIEMHFG